MAAVRHIGFVGFGDRSFFFIAYDYTVIFNESVNIDNLAKIIVCYTQQKYQRNVKTHRCLLERSSPSRSVCLKQHTIDSTQLMSSAAIHVKTARKTLAFSYRLHETFTEVHGNVMCKLLTIFLANIFYLSIFATAENCRNDRYR